MRVVSGIQCSGLVLVATLITKLSIHIPFSQGFCCHPHIDLGIYEGPREPGLVLPLTELVVFSATHSPERSCALYRCYVCVHYCLLPHQETCPHSRRHTSGKPPSIGVCCNVYFGPGLSIPWRHYSPGSLCIWCNSVASALKDRNTGLRPASHILTRSALPIIGLGPMAVSRLMDLRSLLITDM